MKILIISSTSFHSTYGGGQVYLKNIVDEFINQLSDILIAEPGDVFENKETYKGVTIFGFNKSGNTKCFIDFLKKLKPDIVHAHGYKDEFSKACASLDIPCIVTAHHGGILCPVGTLLNYKDEICHVKASHESCLPCVLKNIRWGSFAYPLLKQLPETKARSLSTTMKRKPFIHYVSPVLGASGAIQKKEGEWESILKYTTKMIAPSKAISDAMIRNGFPADKLVLIPHGIPLPNKKYTSLKNQNTKPQFFYLGRINHVKGVHVLCEALKHVKVDFDLNIYGHAVTKVEKRYLLRLKKKYKNENRIHWHGGIPSNQVFDIISTMDVMIHPTICMEIFGLNIAEALALKTPVIATRCGGAEMQIKNGENGLLVEPNDSVKLAHAIETVLNNQYNFNVDSKQVFTIEQHIKELKRVYEKVAY